MISQQFRSGLTCTLVMLVSLTLVTSCILVTCFAFSNAVNLTIMRSLNELYLRSNMYFPGVLLRSQLRRSSTGTSHEDIMRILNTLSKIQNDVINQRSDLIEFARILSEREIWSNNAENRSAVLS